MSELEDLREEVATKTQTVQELEQVLLDLKDQLKILQEKEEDKEIIKISCPACLTPLIITPPTGIVAAVVTPLYCPKCGAEVWHAPSTHYTIAISPGEEIEKPFYKKWTFWVPVGGIAAIIAAISTHKKNEA